MKDFISLSVSEGDVADHFPPLSVDLVCEALLKSNTSNSDYILCALTEWPYNMTVSAMTIVSHHAGCWRSYYSQDGLDPGLDQI